MHKQVFYNLCKLLWRAAQTFRAYDIEEDLAIELDRQAVQLAASVGKNYGDLQQMNKPTPKNENLLEVVAAITEARKALHEAKEILDSQEDPTDPNSQYATDLRSGFSQTPGLEPEYQQWKFDQKTKKIPDAVLRELFLAKHKRKN